MFDQYKKEYDDIHVPSHLKTKTLLNMKEEEAKRSYPWKFFTITMVSIALGCFVFLINPMEQSNIITNLKVGMTIQQVEVKNGTLFFEKDEVQNRKFGQSNDVTIKTIDKNTARQFSKEKIEPLTLEGYVLESKRYYAYFANDNMKQVEWQFVYQNKTNVLDIRYISPYNEIVTNSTMNGKDLAIYYAGDDDKTQYDVYFNKGKGMYHISASDISQEEFIMKLLNFLEKVK